jgi:hypothetical protein
MVRIRLSPAASHQRTSVGIRLCEASPGSAVAYAGAGNAEPDRPRLFTPRDESTVKDRGMVKLGYRLMAEEHGPAALVRNTVRAEQAGFAFAAISDYFFPWLDDSF